MNIVYSIGIYAANLTLKFLALFNTKLRMGVNGRKDTFKLLKSSITVNDKVLWFHCASLGEYEQGLPVFEALKKAYSNYKVVLSFFSPSGYEVKKNSPIADVVVYLPLDTPRNARQFLDLTHPDYIVFVKYELWPNFLLEIKKRQLHAILISALFRNSQAFFKWYGGFFKSALFAFQHIFTQNESSKALLERIAFTSVSVSGDTRFDRVLNQLNINNSIDFIETFVDDTFCIVFGSSWPDDDKLFIDFINTYTDTNIKFIIAPHNIKPSYSKDLVSQITKRVTCYSDMSNSDLKDSDVFILDTIGYLSSAYSYASIAYVGGGAGNTGLHNILEPAVFGIPIVIGENYDKFPEAKALTKAKGVISISDKTALKYTLESFINDGNLIAQTGAINKTFIEQHKGAVEHIMNYFRTVE